MKSLLLAALLSSAVAAAGGDPPLPPGAAVRFGSVEPQGKERRLDVLAYSPDGKLLAAGGIDGSVRLFSPTTGREVKRLSGHQGFVEALAFSPDGRLLASGGEDRRLLLHDVGTGSLLRAIRPGRVGIDQLAFMPGGASLVSSGARHNLEVWDAATGANLRSLTEHPERVLAMALSPDGRYVATSSDDNSLHLWDAATGRRLFTKEAPHGRGTYILDLAFSVDGGTLIARDRNNGLLCLVEVPSGARFDKVAIGGTVDKLLPLPTGSGLGLAYGNTTRNKWSLDVMDPATKARVTVFRNQAEAGATFAFSPDGRSVAVSGPHGTGLIWPVGSGAAPAAPSAGPAPLSTAAMRGLMESWEDPARAESYFDAQRRRYSESEDYDPNGEAGADELMALRQAVEDEDFKEALALAEALLSAQPVHLEAHELAAAACFQLGEKDRGLFHRRVARGLLDSVLRSGDGKAPGTAFRTVYMEEQQDVMAAVAPGREVLSRATVDSGDRKYDAWQLAPKPGGAGEGEAVYFDITPIWRWEMRRFGVKE